MKTNFFRDGYEVRLESVKNSAISIFLYSEKEEITYTLQNTKNRRT